MKRSTKIVLLMVTILQCLGIFDHSLWTPDEPRVAEIAREMAVSGDYLIPHHARQPFLEQPPLYYATAALLFHLFGTGNEGIGRAASALFSIATLLVVFWGVRRLYAEETAALAVAILASTCLFFQVSHKMLVDSALGLFVTLALFGFLLAYQNRWRAGYPIFWVGTTLAFLTKGIIGIALPGVAVATFILWRGDLGMLRRIWAIPGMVLLLGVMGIWSAILYHAGGTDFLRTFFIYNQVGRFFQSGIYSGGHVRPIYYYLGSLWCDGAPWSLLLIPFFGIQARPLDDVKRFLCAWFLGGIVFLSLSSTKRGLYLLPLLPAMAVMGAAWLSGMAGRDVKKWERGMLYLLGGMLALGALGLPIGYVYGLQGEWATGTAALGASLGAALLLYRSLRPTVAQALVLAWCLLLLVWTPVLFPQIDRHKGYKDLFVAMGRIVTDRPVAGFQLNETVEALAPFYGGFWVENIEDRHSFEQFLARKTPAYAIVLPGRLDAELQARLQRSGVRLIKDANHMRREIELWKLGKG